jgi:hypothetical protein
MNAETDETLDDLLGQLVGQLRAEVGAVVHNLSALLPLTDVLGTLEQRTETYSVMWATELLGGNEQVAHHLMKLLWPDRQPDVAWWQTPIGQAVARSTEHRAVTG